MKLRSLIAIIVICMPFYFSCAPKGEETTEAAPKQYELTDIEKSALAAAQKQLEGYNNRDIELFLDAYADTVKVFRFPATLNYQGKDKMRERYSAMFDRTPDLHCYIISEVVKGNMVIHEERVLRNDPENLSHAVAIYVVDEGKITEVYFL